MHLDLWIGYTELIKHLRKILLRRGILELWDLIRLENWCLMKMLEIKSLNDFCRHICYSSQMYIRYSSLKGKTKLTQSCTYY